MKYDIDDVTDEPALSMVKNEVKKKKRKFGHAPVSKRFQQHQDAAEKFLVNLFFNIA